MVNASQTYSVPWSAGMTNNFFKRFTRPLVSVREMNPPAVNLFLSPFHLTQHHNIHQHCSHMLHSSCSTKPAMAKTISRRPQSTRLHNTHCQMYWQHSLCNGQRLCGDKHGLSSSCSETQAFQIGQQFAMSCATKGRFQVLIKVTQCMSQNWTISLSGCVSDVSPSLRALMYMVIESRSLVHT